MGNYIEVTTLKGEDGDSLTTRQEECISHFFDTQHPEKVVTQQMLEHCPSIDSVFFDAIVSQLLKKIREFDTTNGKGLQFQEELRTTMYMSESVYRELKKYEIALSEYEAGEQLPETILIPLNDYVDEVCSIPPKVKVYRVSCQTEEGTIIDGHIPYEYLSTDIFRKGIQTSLQKELQRKGFTAIDTNESDGMYVDIHQTEDGRYTINVAIGIDLLLTLQEIFGRAQEPNVGE